MSDTKSPPETTVKGLRDHWRNDLIAWFSVALVALPLALGIATALGFFTRVVPLPKLIVSHPELVYGLFFGLIVASVYVLLDNLKPIRASAWLWLALGCALGLAVVNTVPTDWEVAGNGDYNGDGKSDILWRRTGFGGVGGDGRNWMYLMNGATIDSSVCLNTVSTDWYIAGDGDYNGDAKADILWRNDSTGQNWEYQMDGSTIINSVGTTTVSGAQWQIITCWPVSLAF